MLRNYLILLLIIILPALLYANALSNSFHYDDLHTIVNNPHIRPATFLDGFSKSADFFSSSQYYSSETHRVGHYRPLLYTSYVFNYWITGLNPAGFRVVNLALHMGCVILVYVLALYLLADGTMALLAVLIFAIHPFFSEAINYISARSSLLATLFYLLAFYTFIKWRDSWSVDRGAWHNVRDAWTVMRGSWRHLILFTLSAVGALLSKEIALTLPLMLIIYDLFWTKRMERKGYMKLVLPYIPIALMGLIVLYKIDFIQYFREVYITNEFYRNYGLSIFAQIKGLVLMVVLFLFPLRVSIDHGITHPTSVFEPGVIVAFLVLLGILGSALLIRHSHRVVAFSLFWFIITSLPTTLIPLNIPFLENRGYLPGVGLSMVMGWVLGIVVRDPWIVIRKLNPRTTHHGSRVTGHRWALVLCALLFITYAGATVYRNTVWRDPVTLWSDAISKAPGSERAWTNLGLAYLSEKDHKQAIEAFKQALVINPGAAMAKVGLGSSYHLQGRLDEAIQFYQDSILLYPEYFLPYFNLGVAYQEQGRFEEALKAYQESLRINAHHPETHLNLGSVYFALEKPDLAIGEYLEALRLNPELSDAHYNLGVAYEMMGRAELADQHYREAERVKRRDE
jgi:Tfp pilus assembly protein PilF